MNKADGNNARRDREPRAVVFMDLDDSIFQTARKCGPGPLETAALGLDGTPVSFFNPEQKRLLDIFAAQAWVIPTTARNLASFRRVRVASGHGAILDHGGFILRADGQPDPEWHNRMLALYRDNGGWLTEAKALADQIILRRALTCRARLISDSGLDFYLVIKNYNSRPAELAVLETDLAEFGRTVGARLFRNDNNLSLVPAFLDKAEAVSYFLANHLQADRADVLVMGLGDSQSDLPFLRLCDFMLMPSRSQLADGLDWKEKI